MGRRASVPTVEGVEARVLTTAGLRTPHATFGRVQPSASTSWTSISLRNDTNRPITYRIVISTQTGPPTVRQETLNPGGRAPWRNPYPTGGIFPHFTVTFQNNPANRFSSMSKTLYPSTTPFEPDANRIIQNSLTYAFKTNPNGTIGLVPVPIR